jgi:hypothetical protein
MSRLAARLYTIFLYKPQQAVLASLSCSKDRSRALVPQENGEGEGIEPALVSMGVL